MSVKINQEFLLDKLKLIYPDNKISIVEWNGYTKKVKFHCDICDEIHSLSDARMLLNLKTYCRKKSNPTKFDQQTYSERINQLHKENVEIVEYNGLRGPVKYICPRCGQIKSCNPASTLITKLSLCDECYGIEHNVIKKKIDQLFSQSNKYELLVWRGVNNKLTEKCLLCGNIYDRYPVNVLKCFDSCLKCNTAQDKTKLDISIAQSRIDEEFGENSYQLLKYKGQLNKHNKIKCLSCGLIFEAHFISFLASRGCPKCKRFKSKGEQKVQEYLEQNNIKFEAQKRFKDYNNNLSSFDFCAYDNQDKMYLIEINGIQHYIQNGHFEPLEVIQKRDNIKQNYCMEHNIPLIIIPYTNLTDKDINNYLSFLKGSTTIL